MPIRLLRRLIVYTPVIVLTLESFCRLIRGAPWQPAQVPSMCPESASGPTTSTNSCQRCPSAPAKAPSRSSCSLVQEELGQPSSGDSTRVRRSPTLAALDSAVDAGRPLLRRLTAFRRLEVHGASPPIQLLLVTFRN